MPRTFELCYRFYAKNGKNINVLLSSNLFLYYFFSNLYNTLKTLVFLYIRMCLKRCYKINIQFQIETISNGV